MKWHLRFETLTERDRPKLAHVYALLSLDAHVHSFEAEDDPTNPFVTNVRVNFKEGYRQPAHPDLQRMSPAVAPLPATAAELAKRAVRVEEVYQRHLDTATLEVSAQPDVPGWVRPGRWVRHIEGGWTARITEVIGGLAPRVRYTPEDGRGVVSRPVIERLEVFVVTFLASEKPLPPRAFYQRLLSRRPK